MNLNEAFRFQNAITGMYNKAVALLRYDYNTMKVTQTHNRKAANPEAVDETMEVVNDNACKIKADDLIKFACRMVEEKEKLAAAISKAKASLDFDFDAECALNGARRDIAERLKALNTMEGRTRRTRGSDFKFNINGEQVPYSYFVDEKSEVAFDKGAVRKAMKCFAEKADEFSKKLDLAEVSTEVEYEPPFSINDSFEDVVADVLASAVNE